MTAASGLLVHLARFARALRAEGIEIGVGDEVDAARALTLVDLLDRDEVRRTLRIALKVRHRDWEVFDLVFRAVWTGEADVLRRRTRTVRCDPVSPATVGMLAVRRPVEVGTSAAPPTAGDRPGYSPEALLRRKPFDQCSAADFAEMEHLLARLVPVLATRKSRRLVPVRGRGIADPRRSFRRAVGTGGELIVLARRARAIEEPEFVVLCDTSGSMDPHTRFMLAFVLSLRRAVRRTEAFAFNTSLTRLTPWLKPGKIAVTLDRLAAGVPDWAGGTKIGESLATFVARYLEATVTRRTIVVILSDGLDRGDTTLVADAMRRIHARARSVVWLNPLAGDPRYQPTARAMQAALPFVDRLSPAHNLDSLERALRELAA